MNLICLILVTVPLTVIVSVSCTDTAAFIDCLPLGKRPASNLPLPRVNGLNDIMSRMYDLRSIQFSRHHVIPWSRIRDFFNIVLNKNRQGVCITLFELVNRIMERVSPDQNYEVIPVPDLVDNVILRLISAVRKEDRVKILNAQHGQQLSTMIHAFFSWFPGNIFIGPSPNMRSDDPEEEFETNSRYIIGEKLYGMLSKANELMIQYIRASSSNANDQTILLQSILNALKETFVYTEPFPYLVKNWEYDTKTKKFKIRKTSFDVTVDEHVESTTSRGDLRRNKRNYVSKGCTYHKIYNFVKTDFKNFCLKAKSNSCDCAD